MIARLILFAAASAFAWGQTAQALEPSPTLTKVQGEVAFSAAVILTCLTQQEQGVSIDDLSSVYRQDMIAAEGADRQWHSNEKPTGKVWISKTLGSHLRVATLGPHKCQVIADQLPVDDTLRRTQLVAERLDPPFSAVAVKPGYNPIVYEAQRTKDGRRVVIHTEGAEPGGVDHASRLALLIATVTTP